MSLRLTGIKMLCGRRDVSSFSVYGQGSERSEGEIKLFWRELTQCVDRLWKSSYGWG